VFSPVIIGNGAVNVLAGTTTLRGFNTYTGATTVNGGALFVDFSIASSIITTVNNGARLGGSGTVGTTLITPGGTLSPGPSSGTPGTLTVAGNLAFQSGAFYVVQVNPATASTTNASGTASLVGTVMAAFAPGSYMARTYPILTASGGRIGTFDSLTTTGLPTDFQASLSYTGNGAILNLIAALEAPGETADERGVAHALDTSFNTGHALPPNLAAVFNLTGGALDRALDELDGEVATGAQQVAFQLMNQFLGIMLDPFVDGRSNPLGGSAIGFAPTREELPDDIALAYAKILKVPPKPPSFEQPWSVWGAGYGGSNRTTGDPAVVGSQDLSAATAGGAAGLDYRLAPGTVVGFALAGGGTSWGLAQGLGTGKSDAFQAGVYGTTRWGPAYLAADFAFTNHWMSTDRFAFEGDHLAASFNAQSFGGRVESGYRFATIYGGLTPYAAIQVQSFHTPSYSENDLNGGGDALAFNSRNAHDTRTEVGGRFDRLLLLDPTAALTLRARLAWAHDSISDPTLAAVFQTLPGSNFIVGGATPAKNSALTSAGTELRLANGVTLLAKFDGEFASHSSTYAGTGAIRYRW
jgi:outer membrane autotransporter protein